jgi:hypothetical protein
MAGVRRLARLVSVALGAIVIMLVATAGTAFAHFPVVSGTVACADGTYTITWSVWNNSGGGSEAMNLISSTVTTSSQSSATVTWNGDVTNLQPGQQNTVTGTTILPGSESGTVTLTVIGRYLTGDFPDTVRSASVELPEPCVPPSTTTTTAAITTTTAATTTTTAATTTTTVATSTTTTTAAPTTTTAAPTTTTPSTAPATAASTVPQAPSGGGGLVTTPAGGGGQLAFTGATVVPLLVLAAAAIASGLVVLRWSRRSGSQSATSTRA